MHGGDDDIKNTYMWLGDPVTIIGKFFLFLGLIVLYNKNY